MIMVLLQLSTHEHKLKARTKKLKSLGLLEKQRPPIIYNNFKIATAKLSESCGGETADSAPSLKGNVCSRDYSWLNSFGGVVLRRTGC